MKRRVLFIVSPFFGGASRMTINIASQLDRNEYDIKFLVSGRVAQDILSFLPKNTEYECLNIKNIWDFTTIKLYRIIKKSRVDIIFSSFTHMNIRVAIAGKLAKKKVILRSNNYLCAFPWINKVLMKVSYPLADVIVAQNEDMQAELQEFLPRAKGKIIFLYNFIAKATIDVNLEDGNPYPHTDEVRFVWTARVSKEKGQDLLLKAFKIVREELSNAHLYLLGKYNNDVYYKNLVTYIEENGLSDFVHFKGLLPNPHVWIKYAQCFVLPSRIEGLPNALLESMYIGTPVVSTRCIPIITRIVEEGQNGYTVAAENQKEMAEAMLKALKLKNCKMTFVSTSEEQYRQLFTN